MGLAVRGRNANTLMAELPDPHERCARCAASAREVALMRRFFWFLLLAGLGLLALTLRHEQGTIAGLEVGDFGSLIYKIALLVLVGGAVLALFRERIGEAFQAAMFWVVIGLVLALGYTYRYELRDIGERLMTELVPGRAATRNGNVEISRGRGGEFQITTQVNGSNIPSQMVRQPRQLAPWC